MRVFNLTDVETPALRQKGLVNVTFAAGRVMVAPGQVAETADDAFTQQAVAFFVTAGAAAVDRVPPDYAVAKDRMKKAEAAEEKGKSDEPPPVLARGFIKKAKK